MVTHRGEAISIIAAIALIMPALNTTIPLRRRTRDRLRGLGSKGETYDEVLNRVMEQAELASHLDIHYHRLKNKSKFIPLDDL